MIEAWLEKAVGIIWNYPVVGLCLGVGLFFTLRMAFVQIRCFPHALALVSGKYDKEHEPGQITHFQALSAALSGTIGLGNIAGVAIAIAMGGPGAVLWMWIVAFLGMATKYAECALGTIYRDIDPVTGRTRGGPMYYITKGLGQKWYPMAAFFCLCTAIGSFGFANMFQANQVSQAMTRYYGTPDWLIGIVLAALVGLTIIGGINRIGYVASKLVPGMSVLYILGAVLVCIINVDKIPLAFSVIFSDAFTGQAAAGGVVGAVVITGVRRAVFSNEAGLGSAPIAHAAVKTDYPIREGIVASLGPLIDTIIVCTATALVIVIAGNYGNERYDVSTTLPMNNDFVTSGDWNMSQKIPDATHELQDFRTGDWALAYNGSEEASVLTPPIRVKEKKQRVLANKSVQQKEMRTVDGIRFSSYYEGGKRSVQVLDSTGGLIAELPINQEDNSFSVAGVPLLDINKSLGSGKWQSHIINFSPAFKKRIQSSDGRLGNLRLRFTCDNGTWYVDRIQAVKELTGIQLTTVSFDKYFQGWAGLFITLAVLCFSYSTMITWSFYGETAASYVLGPKSILPFKVLFVICAFIGATTKLTIVLNFSDLMSGLMVIPNAIAILLLSGVVIRETSDYFKRLQAGEFEPRETEARGS